MLAEEEVRETAAGFRKAADFVRETKVAADVAIHFTSLNWNMFEQQGIVKGLNYQQSVVGRFYKPLIDLGLRPDVIDAHAALDGYRVVFSPLMLTLEEAGLPQRMEQWVREGGTWIVGPLSDERNRRRRALYRLPVRHAGTPDGRRVEIRTARHRGTHGRRVDGRYAHARRHVV